MLGRSLFDLWRVAGHEFTPMSFAGIEKDSAVTLWRCQGCGFEFFDPQLAGGSSFYEAIQSEQYYTPARPEFSRTLLMAKREKLTNVLDVGCGAGAFLDQAASDGLKTYGIELNVAAADTVRSRGHIVFSQLLSDLSPSERPPGGFDLITFFQVVEHLSAPVEVVRQAVKLLRPGGWISIAVPSKRGIYRFMPWDPSNWPPHHISRWELADFKNLSSRIDLNLVESGGDILLGSTITQALVSRRAHAFALGLKKNSPLGIGTKSAIWLYRKTGLKYIAPRWGSSIWAHMQKPT